MDRRGSVHLESRGEGTGRRSVGNYILGSMPGAACCFGGTFLFGEALSIDLHLLMPPGNEGGKTIPPAISPESDGPRRGTGKLGWVEQHLGYKSSSWG